VFGQLLEELVEGMSLIVAQIPSTARHHNPPFERTPA
jgi:hypothetical protein